MLLVRPLWDCYTYTQGCLSNIKGIDILESGQYLLWLRSVSLVHILISLAQ